MIYESGKRVAFVDIMKAITIFLVVLGHTPICSAWLIRWIYAFHMPAFFAVYGMTYDAEIHKQRKFLSWDFIISKAKRLLVPCFIWGIIYASFSIKSVALVLWGSQASLKAASSLTSIWFLSCMFLCVIAFEILMWALSKLKTSIKAIVLAALAIVFFAVGCFLPKIGIGYPWGADTMFPALSFIIAGYGVRFAIGKLPKLNEGKPLIWICLCAIFALLTLTFIPNLANIDKNNADFASRTFGNPFLYVIAALAGTLMLVSLSVLISKIKWMQWLTQIGKYSLAILLLHKFPVVFIGNYLAEKGLGNTLTAILLAIVITALSFFAAKLIEYLAPNLIGISNRSKSLADKKQ